MSINRIKKTISSRIICISTVVIIALAISFMVILSKSSLLKNVENRALQELSSLSATQATTLTYNLDKQYSSLAVIADMLEHGIEFDSEEMQPALESAVRTYRMCMLGFADMAGNVTDYSGDKIGNIADRAYFTDIVNGIADRRCEYLATTKRISSPRVMFSIPVYRDGEMYGVLFDSKEISVLEEALFQDSDMPDVPSGIFICDSDGNLIVQNDDAANWLSEHGFIDNREAEGVNIYNLIPDFRDMQSGEANAKRVNLTDYNLFAAYMPLEINNWSLYCVMEEADALQNFGKNLASVKQLIGKISCVFIAALIYIAILANICISRRKREAQTFKQYHENYKTLLKELHCAVLEYDIATDKISIIQSDLTTIGLDSFTGAKLAHLFKASHPKYGFIELDKEIQLVRESGKVNSFETIIEDKDGEIRWLRIILIPIMNNENTVTKITGAVMDVSDMHDQFSTDAEVIAQIPSGIHRCYLSNPIHLEYFSDGLCKMLGYTHEEFAELVTADNRYSLAIYAEDRPKFSAFVRKLAEEGGLDTCDYRMICKDGSLLWVSDTMEARLNPTGIMYGYSVVTDLSQYRKMQAKLELELEETKQELDKTRIKNFNSQMQPHFLYNALASIREIVLDDPEYAADLIYDFSMHLRACIRSMANDNLIPFSQELTNIKAYVNIEKMRFGDRLNIEYDCPETEFDIIPLSIQPLVENAIRHGVYERGVAGGTVKISTRRTKDSYLVEIADNGVGFDYDEVMAQVQDGKRDSTGLFNLIYRFEMLMKAKVDVQSEIGKGTKITVIIPITRPTGEDR